MELENFKVKTKSAYVENCHELEDPEPTFDILVCAKCNCEYVDDAEDGELLTYTCRECGNFETVKI